MSDRSKINFVFDVDGTLTPSRSQIDPTFKEWFIEFSQNHNVYIVTGGSYSNTIAQLGAEIVDNAQIIFNCLGNSVIDHGEMRYQNTWHMPSDLEAHLRNRLVTSEYHTKTGNHFEYRTGVVNFSILGRNATTQQRQDYYKWDIEHHERQSIVEYINKFWDNVEAAEGGETGIDIFQKGHDKSQILKYINGDIYFFGDKMTPNGNDWSLAQKIIEMDRGLCYNVKSWKDTFNILKAITRGVKHSNA